MKKNYSTSSQIAKNQMYSNAKTFFVLAFLIMFFVKPVMSQTYCAAAATSTADDEIFNVTLGTLNNSSTCSTTGGPGSVLNEYSDYTATVPAPILMQGSNYPLSVTVGMCGSFGYSGIVSVWIDYNQNGLFTDPGENIITSPYTAFAITGTALSVPGGITIPMTALPGTTRMRIIETESSTAPTPCSNPTWGEVEDYNVTILSPHPIDLTIDSLIKPLSSKHCYGKDTIIARIRNYGSNVMDFSVTPAVLTVKVSGAATNTFTTAINTGTLGIFATGDYTVTSSYNMSTTGIYSFKSYATVAGDGDSTNDTLVRTVNKYNTPTPSLGHDSVVCNLPFLLNANTLSTSYLWSNGAISSNINVTTSGTYWVKATNSNGCANSDTVNITLGNLPIVTLGADTGYCQGSVIHLYAGNPGCSYLWSTGSTASSITVGSAGTYSVVVTNSTSCKSSDIVNVTAKSNPTVSLVFNTQKVFCPTDASGRPLTEGVPAGGAYIGSGVTGSSFFANQAGQGAHIILYSYTGPNGCSSIAKDTLVVNACVGIEELSSSIGLNVYPNPSTGIFTLEITTQTDLSSKLSIASIDGRLVYSDTVSGNGLITKSINITDLATGIYYLKLETKDAIKTYKILKQ